MNSRIELGDEDLNLLSESLLQRVERVDMVSVAVSERHPADLAAGEGRRCDELVGGAAGRRVNVKPSSSRTR
jgi:hypothetical protein